nr:hypothetical protein Itr_chr06CG00540 [Ipomoea trifida]
MLMYYFHVNSMQVLFVLHSFVQIDKFIYLSLCISSNLNCSNTLVFCVSSCCDLLVNFFLFFYIIVTSPGSKLF